MSTRSNYKIEDDFCFMQDDIVQTTPLQHPHITAEDLNASCADCKATMDALRAKFGNIIIGTRISFDVGAPGKPQFAQFRFVDDNLATLTQTGYETRRGGVNSGCDQINNDLDWTGECRIQGFVKALLRFVEKHPDSM